MKKFNLTMLAKSATCAFVLAVLMSVAPAFAQNNTGTTNTGTTTTRVAERDDDTDYGWLGLLGLLGLAGLLKKPKQNVVHRDTDNNMSR